MPVTAMRNGLTAENSIFSQKPTIKVPRSRFDLGRLNCFTSDIGMIVPVDLIPTLPNDDFDLSCQYKIDFRPLLVPTLTAYKVKVHYYFCPMSYLWSGWESFISKGRSGKLALTVPKINLSSFNEGSIGLSGLTDSALGGVGALYHPACPHSLIDYLVGSIPYDSKDSSKHYLPFALGETSALSLTGFKLLDVSALPFLMYQKIYRSNYLDPNLYSNGVVENKVWFPDDIDSSDWRFDYSASNLGGMANCYFVPRGESFPEDTAIANFVPIAQPIGSTDLIGDNCVNLTQLRYAMYSDDMFTTALPFLQRGLQTSLDLDVSSSISTLSDFGLKADVGSSDSPTVFVDPASGRLSYSDSGSVFPNFKQLDVNFIHKDSNVLAYPLVTSSTSPVNFSANFTAQQLRSLLALSVWQERNALTNGSYGQFIRVHFDDMPNNQFCEPIYIGGTTSNFNVNSVVQTSASSDGSTPQGTQTGIGGSSGGSSLGHFRSKDFGYIMALMTIIPDNVYCQSHDHWEFDTNPDDFYMPEYEQLSYQPILNKQLYVSGTASTDDSLFGYSNRYVYLKQRDSIARGRFGLPASVDSYYHSYVQTRQFGSTPKLSQQFVTVYPPNIDRSFLAYPGEPAFLVQFYSGVNAVRALSYTSQPNTFGF